MNGNALSNPHRQALIDRANKSGLEPFSAEFAAACDAQDPLAKFRAEFSIPPRNPQAAKPEPSVYLCGHSLGAQPKRARKYVVEELDDWAQYGVTGHWKAQRPWVSIEEPSANLVTELVGALKHEVACQQSLTANLHLMMVAFYRPTHERCKILIETHAFPSDHYAVESQIRFHGHDPAKCLIEVKPRPGEELIDESDIEAVIKEHGHEIALMMLPGVQYYTGQLFDIPRLTRVAHEAGCVVGWDLAHAVGNVPLKLHEWNPDFAVWCSYKYLNSSPGALGGMFVHDRHANDMTLPRFAGWWGHEPSDRFKMDNQFKCRAGAPGFGLSNPPVLVSVTMQASLELFHEAGIQNLRAKSLLLTSYLEMLLDEQLAEKVTIITPRDPARRGAQLSLKMKLKLTLEETVAELARKGIHADDRKPDVIRVAPAPFYCSFADVFEFVTELKKLL